MALYLVQHGHARPKEANPERSLTEQGCREVKLIADLACDQRITVSRIVHSGKKRARQTAQIFADELFPEYGIARRDGLGATNDVASFARTLDSAQNLMLVGHLPFMEKLVSHLIVGTQEVVIVKFQMGGIVCLEQLPESGAWYIKWTLMPAID